MEDVNLLVKELETLKQKQKETEKERDSLKVCIYSISFKRAFLFYNHWYGDAFKFNLARDISENLSFHSDSF